MPKEIFLFPIFCIDLFTTANPYVIICFRKERGVKNHMNQILYVENKKSGPIEIKKVALFFSIAVILFGVILIGEGSYALFNNQKDNQNPVVNTKTPDVRIDRVEENIAIHIIHEVPITKIVYHWNKEADKVIEGQGQKEITQKLLLPFGTNTLYLKIIDQNGQESEYTKEYIVEGQGKPVIELLVTQNNEIRIKVQDNTGLKYMKYAWNNGEEIIIHASAQDSTMIDHLVEIPLGQNTLKVEAVNTNDISTVKDLEVRGVKKPRVTLRQDGMDLIIHAEDDNAMKVVNYTLNGQAYQLNFGDVKVIEYRQPLQRGDNYIELSAENKDGGITNMKGKCPVQ